MRSLLFVPGDSARKIEKALTTDADAIVFDLEDAVAPASKTAARELLAEILQDSPAGETPSRLVRINALTTQDWEADLDAVLPLEPAAIILPKPTGAGDIRRVSNWLRIHNSRVPLIVLATETPRSVLNMSGYLDVGADLSGLVWGGEDLAASIGATANRNEAGNYTAVFQHARTQCLLTAAALSLPAYDAAYMNFRDLAGLREESKCGARDGFSGKLAIHPDQVPVINEAFTPSAEEIARANAVLAAFEKEPDAGVVALNGQMLDEPHRRAAQRLLQRAKAVS